MTHFLIANLNGGRFGNSTILSPEGIAAMHSPVVPVASQLGSGTEYMAMDWAISQIGGVEVIMKGGDNSNYKTNMVLVPSQHLGIVMLVNINDPIGAFFGDRRIALLTYNVAELLLGQTVSVFPVSPMPMLLKGVLLLVIAIQLAGMALTLVRLWRMRSWRAPVGFSQQPNKGALRLHIGIPLVINLAWGLFVLVAVPPFLKMPLSFMQYMLPTLGYTILVSGVVALGWAFVRTVLVYLVMFQRTTPTTEFVGAPVNTSVPTVPR
jgi:hypothetical protein